MGKAATSRRKFKSELSQILNIITHSLYSHSEVFLRELISNASDAIDRLRFQAITDEALLNGDKDWQIKLVPDRIAGTLTISDNGIGMDRQAIIENLGTIARSGTKAFLEALAAADAKGRPELIGQFGVGFYAAFMVAERVTVRSRMADQPPSAGVEWVSDGLEDFTVEEVEKTSRGTDVILHLKQEAKEYLEPTKLREVVKAYSDFIEHPVVMDGKILNARTALWLRDKGQIKPEEYDAFYQQISHDSQAPAKVIHYIGEGTTEFVALLFIPTHMPLNLMFGDLKFGPKLYIKRVLIMDACQELLPPYLRFVSGVVDCPDLPLNVSRELLQHNPILTRIRRNVVKAVLKALEEMKQGAYDRYVACFKQLGEVLKEGLAQDPANQEAVADLCLFESLRTDKGHYTTLIDYAAKMPEGQKEIYYLSGESRAQLEGAPHVEAFKERGWDVLLLTDPVDEFVLPYFTQYQEKPLKAADKGFLEGSQVDSPLNEKFLPLLEVLRRMVREVKEVRLSARLKDSPSCLVSDEEALGAHMERLLKRMGKESEIPQTQRILELNPHHAVVKALQGLHQANPNDPRVENYARLLYEQALITAGLPLQHPSEFAKRLNELLIRDTIRH